MRNFIHFFFILSIFIGTYLSIGPIYIYHILMVLICIYICLESVKKQQLNIYPFNKWYILVFFASFIWMFLSNFWTLSNILTFSYIAYFSVGFSIIFIILVKYNSDIHLEKNIIYIRWMAYIILVICFVEMFLNFRLPGSPSNYLASSTEPTAFWGNPNNLATVLNLIFPFILFSKNKIKWIVSFLILVAMFYTKSRLNLLAYFLILIIYLIYEDKRKSIKIISFSTIVIFVLFFVSAKIREIMINLFLGIDEVILSIKIFASLSSLNIMDSTGVRQNLYLKGIQGLIDSNFIGVGAGASPILQIAWLGETGAMHNFWLEILVEQGIIFFILFMAWYIFLITKNYSIFKENKNRNLNRIAGAISVSLLGFIIGALSPSSTIYLLPMWLIFALALMSITIHEGKRR